MPVAAPTDGGTGSAASPAAPPSQSQLQSWFQGWLAQDPIYQAQFGQIQAQENADKSNLASVVNQLMIQYGLTGDLAASAKGMGLTSDEIRQLLGNLNPNTEKAAALNNQLGTSVLGALQNSNTQARDTITGDLAARGMLDSGDNAERFGQQQIRYDQGLSNAMRGLFGTFNRDQQTEASNIGSLQDKLASLQSSAWTRFVQGVQSGAIKPPNLISGGQAGGHPATQLPPSHAAAAPVNYDYIHQALEGNPYSAPEPPPINPGDDHYGGSNATLGGSVAPSVFQTLRRRAVV